MIQFAKGFGAVCGSVLVFALALFAGADVSVSGWALWYLFALSIGAVGGMIVWIGDHE